MRTLAAATLPTTPDPVRRARCPGGSRVKHPLRNRLWAARRARPTATPPPTATRPHSAPATAPRSTRPPRRTRHRCSEGARAASPHRGQPARPAATLETVHSVGNPAPRRSSYMESTLLQQ
eukprot:ctg_588.g271